MSLLTPTRYRGVEILDDPGHDATLAVRSLRDVAKANLLFGGRHAVLREMSRELKTAPPRESRMTLLDIGAGIGDIPAAARRRAARHRVQLDTIGFEVVPALAHAATPACTWGVAGDARALPFADRSIDFVTCSQVLHHFADDDAMQLLQECTRVARVRVIVADLRRSYLAIGGLWASSFVLGFHPISRHDGIVSIRRGYTVTELGTLVTQATGQAVRARPAPGWRVTASWRADSKHTHTARAIR